jgi:hypothetical protein
MLLTWMDPPFLVPPRGYRAAHGTTPIFIPNGCLSLPRGGCSLSHLGIHNESERVDLNYFLATLIIR